ncbi:MAG: response regulator, partial [Melioribacteraceae bacterium]|nr:response regulator [Melioribacteraceae bacterium]
GKVILIVDDEPDVLEALGELLDMCIIDYARDFVTAEKYLKDNSYDAAIFDIMGVEGYKLLQLARYRDLPALMLTAHALSPDYLVKSIKAGAFAYIPKAEMVDIAFFLNDMIRAKLQNDQKSHIWFEKLIPVFNQKFGPDWENNYGEDLKDLNLIHSRE